MKIGDRSDGHIELIGETEQDGRVLRALEHAVREGGWLDLGGVLVRINSPPPQPKRGLAGADAEYRPRGADAACDVRPGITISPADLADIDGVP